MFKRQGMCLQKAVACWPKSTQLLLSLLCDAFPGLLHEHRHSSWSDGACVDVSAYARYSKQTQPVEKAHAEETIGAGLQRARCPGLSPLLNPEAKADPSIKESMSIAAGNSGITFVPKISTA